ncbi:MAG: sulfurtransferase [Rubrivivax sp.]|nr:sulfurtransferase [Rubrivivax sp.]
MHELTVQRLRDFAAAEPATLLLDVREPWETALAPLRLPGVGGLQIPMRDLPARLAEIERSQSIVCICHHGARSAQVVAFLLRQGYPRVYNLAGGVDAWSALVDPAVPRY